MPLKDYIPNNTDSLASQNSTSDPIYCLRDALYEKLPNNQIAEMLQTNPQQARAEVRAHLQEVFQEAKTQSKYTAQANYSALSIINAGEHEALIVQVQDLILGMGVLQPLLNDESITEIMVNSHANVFYEREGKLYKSDISFASELELRGVIDRIVGPLGRRVDEASPYVSARLPQGHRVNCVIPPLAIDGAILTIRKFKNDVFTLNDLQQMGTISPEVANFLRKLVRDKKNIAVSGGTGSGKTTLLNALSVEIDPAERIITIEDAAELKFGLHPHVVRLESRAANSEGTGEVSIRDLVINALRMRPDRIVVGECRGGEALDMLQAMNTGHDGSLTTLHANTPNEVIARLIMMSRYAADLPVGIIEEQIASALDYIVQISRSVSGVRRVTHIMQCFSENRRVVLQPAVQWSEASSQYEWVGSATASSNLSAEVLHFAPPLQHISDEALYYQSEILKYLDKVA